MQITLRALGVAMALVLLGISAAINAKFGYGLGRDESDAMIFATASAAADGLKAVSVFYIAWAVASRQVVAALAGVVIFIVCTGYSLTSAVGFAAVNRVELSESRSIPMRQYQSAKHRIDEYRLQLRSLGPIRSKGEVKAAITAHRRHYRWQSTKGCIDVTAGKSRIYCAQYDALSGELARVRDAVALREKIADIAKEFQALEKKQLAAKPDPQADFLSRLLGVQLADMQLWLALLLAALVELGSGLGLFVSLHSGRNSESSVPEIARPVKDGRAQLKIQPTRGDVFGFAMARITRADDRVTSFEIIYACYSRWCNAKGAIPINRNVAESEFATLLVASGVPVKKGNKGIAFVGIGLETTVENIKALPGA